MTTRRRPPTPLPRLTTFALATALLVTLPLALQAQRDSADEDGLGTFQGETRVLSVQVPVTVVDRDGEPVRGLTVEDFELEDDGDERTITGFEVVDLATLVPTEGRVKPLLRELPSAARRHFLFLFDMSFSNPTSITRAREAARQFILDELHPTDLAAVATFSIEFGPRLLVTFTPDRAQLARAIDAVGAQGLLARAGTDPLRFIINPPRITQDTLRGSASSAGGARERPLAGQAQSAATAAQQVIAQRMDLSEKSYERGQITSWSRSMGDLARALNAVKGRKQVIYFSEGFDGDLLLGRRPTGLDSDTDRDQMNVLLGQNYLTDPDDTFGNTGLQQDVNEMLAELRRADCVVQAVDIGGLRAGGDVRTTIGNRGQESLFYVANETGGELFKDANDLRSQLDRLLQRTSVTYILSFQPDDLEPNGEYRRLKVKVDGHRSSRVSHRDGYYAPRPFPQLHPLEKDLLASDAIASAVPQRDITMNILAVPFKAAPEAAYVPVIIEIHGGEIVEGQQNPDTAVEIYAYVTDEKGEMQDFFDDIVGVLGGKEVLGEYGLKYYGHLDLAPGDHLIRVLVRNAETGRTGVHTVELHVPSFDEDQPVLLPPFFLQEEQRWVLDKEEVADGQANRVVYPFIVKGQPYIPSARPVLKRRSKAELCLVAYNLGAGQVEITGRILSQDGQVVEGGTLALVERTVTGIEGLDKLLATFHPRGLSAGQYTLEVAVVDPNTGSRRTNSIPFQVL